MLLFLLLCFGTLLHAGLAQHSFELCVLCAPHRVDNQTSMAYCAAPLNGSTVPEFIAPCNPFDITDPFPIPPGDPVSGAWRPAAWADLARLVVVLGTTSVPGLWPAGPRTAFYLYTKRL